MKNSKCFTLTIIGLVVAAFFVMLHFIQIAANQENEEYKVLCSERGGRAASVGRHMYCFKDGEDISGPIRR